MVGGPLFGPISYPPLLPLGRHEMSIAELYALCVVPFSLSNTRATIMRGLEDVVTRLSTAKVEGELWVDGSFLTEKIDPNDTDIVLRLESTFVDGWTPEQEQAVTWLATNLKLSHHCDSYAFVRFPDGHPQYWYGEYMYAYWMRQWGFDREDNMRGFAVIKLP